MIDQLKTHIPRHVAIAGIALTGLGFVVGGVDIGIGVAVGGVVAALDAWVLTWLASRVIAAAGFIGRGFAAALLGAKLFVLLAVCWALLARWGVDPIGFSVGLGALVIGVLYSGVEQAFKEAGTAKNAQAQVSGER